MKKGKIKPVGGGRTIVQELEACRKLNLWPYSRLPGFLNIAASDTLLRAEWNTTPLQAVVAMYQWQGSYRDSDEAIVIRDALEATHPEEQHQH